MAVQISVLLIQLNFYMLKWKELMIVL